MVSSLWSSTDDDRHIEEVEPPESSLQSSTDSDRQMEGKDEAQLLDKPTGKPTDGPTDETAVKLIEGYPPNDELTEEHPPGDELAEEHPPGNGLTEGHPLDYELVEINHSGIPHFRVGITPC